jgi:hypothetical protein
MRWVVKEKLVPVVRYNNADSSAVLADSVDLPDDAQVDIRALPQVLQDVNQLDFCDGIIGPGPGEFFQVVAEIRVSIFVNVHITGEMSFSAA